MQAETQTAADWWARPRGLATEHWVGNYQRSMANRHRDVILAAVQALAPRTLLEVGCHCGPNLIRLAQGCPSLEQLTGCDVSAEAIAAGRLWIAREGLSHRIRLEEGRIPTALSDLPDACVDVVLSCYTLAYVAPGDLDAVLYELGRVARQAVVLAEPMPPTASSRVTMGGYSEWAHDYAASRPWIGTWRGMTWDTLPIVPPVDALTHVQVGRRDGVSMPSQGTTQ